MKVKYKVEVSATSQTECRQPARPDAVLSEVREMRLDRQSLDCGTRFCASEVLCWRSVRLSPSSIVTWRGGALHISGRQLPMPIMTISRDQQAFPYEKCNWMIVSNSQHFKVSTRVVLMLWPTFVKCNTRAWVGKRTKPSEEIKTSSPDQMNLSSLPRPPTR